MKLSAKLLCSALLLIASAPGSAQAGPDRVSILGGSYHVDAKIAFEQVNPGLFVTWEDRWMGLDYSVGLYRNSFGKASVAASAALPVVRWDEGELSLFAGAALYPGDGRFFAVHAGDVVPIGGLQVRHRNLFMQVIPSDGVYTDAIVSAGITFNLHKD